MEHHIKTYDGDSSSTVQVRQSVGDVLHKLQIPDHDIERVLAFYASDIQRIIVPPPPLPPRIERPESDSV